MPGHKLLRSGVKDAAQFDKYQCPHCQLLLKDAVQSACGHWLCESCAVALLQQSSPKCPLPGCQENLKSNVEGEAEHFPDRFVRREINGMIVYCIHRHKECNWEGRLDKLEAHLETCDFTSEECPQCGTILTPEQVESHKLTCPKAMVKCPLADFGCSHSQTMTREELEQHVREHGVQHLNAIADVLKILTRKANITAANNFTDDGTADHSLSLTRCADLVEKDGANQSQASESKYRAVLGSPPDPGYGSMSAIGGSLPDNHLLNATAGLNAAASKLTTTSTTTTAAASKLTDVTSKFKGEIDSRLTAELRQKDEEIATLNWEDRLEKLEPHLETCDFTSEECPQCGTILTHEQVESHKLTCPKTMVECPLAEHGCSHFQTMPREELKQPLRVVSDVFSACSTSVNKDGANKELLSSLDDIALVIPSPQPETLASGGTILVGPSMSCDSYSMHMIAFEKDANKLEKNNEKLVEEIETLNCQVQMLASILCKQEGSENNGTIIWKIQQFSQRMSDAQTGECTSIFSLPFYTGRYGYKMCVQLYILGDGIGKNSHMSLFFVIMKGEFDNILQWPFTQKVTLKLINQTGGRDIIDTFQPDPMSSSFRKPKSAMNNASGCPHFVSHTELKSGGFIEDDTVVIECLVDCSMAKRENKVY